MGKAIISNPAGFGGFNQACIACDLTGTAATVTVGQFQCTCKGPDYNQYPGPFGLVWGQLTNGASYATPALSPDGRLLYVGSSPFIYGIDTVSGNYIWEFQNPFTTDNFVYSNISVGPDGTVYVGGGFSNYFFALDGLTGALKWHYVTGNSDNYFTGKPAFNPLKTMVYIASNGPVATVYAFNFSGTLLYSYTNTDLIADNETVQSVGVGPDGRVYISYDQNLIALTSGLAFRWSVVCGSISGNYNSDWFSPRVDSSGLIYVGSDTDTSRLYCFIDNGSSGTLKWTYTAPAPSFVLSPVFGPAGQVYAAVNRNNITVPATINNAGSLLSFSSVNGSVKWTYNFLGADSNDFFNWIYPTVGPDNRIYLTNVVDSSLVILNDLGLNFGYYKEISNSDADSGVYGSLCLSPPLVAPGGLVYWCNGNDALPGIFGAGYPIVTEVFDGAATTPPVFRPNIRIGPRATVSLVPLAARTLPLKLPFNIDKR
jgi:outer membrane protein assembly factor BamB